LQKSYRIRWEDIPFAIIALGTEIVLIHFHIFRESLIKGNVIFEILKNYGYFIGLIFLMPCMVYMLCDFIVSCKVHKTMQLDLKQKKLERSQTEYEEFLEFYDKYFKKGSQ